MAKRFQPLKEFGRTMKKPKLEVSVNRGRTQDRDSFHTNIGKDFWDDDEDDVILLATQAAESEMAATNNFNHGQMNITDSEVTFSEFAPRIQQHSTQRVTTPAKALGQDLLSQMFDDDDDEFAALAAVADKLVKPNVMAQSAQLFETEPLEPTLFKRPQTPPSTSTSARQVRDENMRESEPRLETCASDLAQSPPIDPKVAARRQIAAERQIKFLMERVESLKNDNAKLHKDLDDAKSSMITKTGESSLLRDELRHMKQQVESLKMEKIFRNEEAAAECKTKINELSKQVQAKESELQLKNMECSLLKMRQADETRRLEQSIRETNVSPTKSANSSKPELRSLMRLRSLNPEPEPMLSVSCASVLIGDAYKKIDERTASNKHQTLFQQELQNIQRVLGCQQTSPSDTLASTALDELLDSVRNVFSEFWSYVHTLEFYFSLQVHPILEYDVLEDKTTRSVGCLHKNVALFPGERAITIRRYIAILSVICGRSSSITHALLTAKHKEDCPLFQIAIEAITKLGYSREICAHFGILESFAALLRGMFLHLSSKIESDKPLLTLLVSLLKEIVFTRPSPWVFHELSYSVLECADRLPTALELFCINSAPSTFVADSAKMVYRFSHDSCLLQVYCGLLESSFPLYLELEKTHFDLQTQICKNHLRFVFYCFANPPEFIAKKLPNDDEDYCDMDTTSEPEQTTNIQTDEMPTTSKAGLLGATTSTSSTNSTSANPTTAIAQHSTCQCYIQLCLGVVTLVYLTLRQWLRTEKECFTEDVASISKIAVHLLHIIFCDNYMTSLFRESEDTTKHYLFLICQWWSENTKELQFDDIHLNFLRKLKSSHVVPIPPHEEEPELDNIAEDLACWCRVAKDDTIDPTDIDPERAIRNLRLMEDIADPEKFFEGFKPAKFDPNMNLDF